MTTNLSHLLTSEYNPKRQLYFVNPMGASLVNSDGTIDTYASDSPHAHAREAENFSNRINNYLSSQEGKNFINYTRQHHRRFIDIKRIGTADHGNPSIVAAVHHNGLEGVLVSNYDGMTFDERIEQMAQQYHVESSAMAEYVITHELTHAAGYNSEAETEGYVKTYFEQRAQLTQGPEREKYLQLAAIASQRELEAKEAGK